MQSALFLFVTAPEFIDEVVLPNVERLAQVNSPDKLSLPRHTDDIDAENT